MYDFIAYEYKISLADFRKLTVLQLYKLTNKIKSRRLEQAKFLASLHGKKIKEDHLSLHEEIEEISKEEEDRLYNLAQKDLEQWQQKKTF